MEELDASFKGLFELALLEEMKQKGRYAKLEPGFVLMELGQVIRYMPILIKGSIKVSRQDEEGKELLLYYINPLESCAMSFTCCMQARESEIRAVAEDEVEYWYFPISVMDEWMQKYSTWKSFVMNTIQSRFMELLKTIDQIAFQSLDRRLELYLSNKSKAVHSKLINLSHQQIAEELATSREVVSRLLKKLENEGKLLLYRGQIKLLKLS